MNDIIMRIVQSILARKRGMGFGAASAQTPNAMVMRGAGAQDQTPPAAVQAVPQPVKSAVSGMPVPTQKQRNEPRNPYADRYADFALYDRWRKGEPLDDPSRPLPMESSLFYWGQDLDPIVHSQYYR